ncbi:MAG: DUF4421 domain-containing protein [Bacteroidaceae bacterium]|nr:DUF4421 domain-containing protein [Bacteroidaceae bacterium]
MKINPFLYSFTLVFLISGKLSAINLQEPDTLKSTTFMGDLTQGIERVAENVVQDVKRKVKDLDEYDKNYIEPNYYNYAAMLQNTNYWQQYRFTAENEKGQLQSINISPRPAFKVGPYFGWRWLFLGYTMDVSNFGQAKKNTEFNLALYSAKVGCDLIYIKNKADFKIGNISGFDGLRDDAFNGYDFDGMKSYSTMVNVYYVFNNRHFSYPAAYAQSTVQRISAGSFILGLRYDHHKMHFNHLYLPYDLRFDNQGNERLFPELKTDRIKYYNIGVSFGYAYNWVPCKNLLLNISLMPALGYKKTIGEPWDKEVLINDVRSLNIDFTGRAALVWNNSKYFAGTSFVTYGYGYKKASFNFRNFISYLNFYVGFNFNRKSQYRK